MEKIILIGSGGCMREIVWQIQELNKLIPTWKIEGYIDVAAPENGQGIMVGMEKIPYLGTDEWLQHYNKACNVAICVGNLYLRKEIAQKLLCNTNLSFPNIILNNVVICEDVKLGMGCILCSGTKISTHVEIGSFAFINMESMICHDGMIGDYVTLSPDVKIAGNVCIYNNCEIGMGAKIKQGITIGEDSIIGAGAVVVKDIESKTVAVGVPAQPIRRGA